MASKTQKKSDQYWINASNTYLASPEYYAYQESLLREIIQKNAPFTEVVDIGCGDGRYTFLALESSKKAVGIDMSPKLIEKAKNNAQIISRKNDVSFEVGTFYELSKKENRFDLVLCLGVTSALIDQDLFKEALFSVKATSTPQGFLITRDTLSVSGKSIETEQGEYVAIYRSEKEYISSFEENGFLLIEKKEIMKATPETCNAIYLFQNKKI